MIKKLGFAAGLIAALGSLFVYGSVKTGVEASTTTTINGSWHSDSSVLPAKENKDFLNKTLYAQSFLTPGQIINFASINFPGYYIRHSSYLGELQQIKNVLDGNDASFKVVRGLANSSLFSFESVNYPGYYLRHYGGRLKISPFENNDLFKADATYSTGISQQGWWFRSYNYPDRFIRHRDYHLYVESRNVNPTSFDADGQFQVTSPNFIGQSVGLESFNYPGYFLRHRNYLGELTTVQQDLDVKDGTFKIVAGLAGKGISFESTNFPGYYLRHSGGRLQISKFENSNLFKADATYFMVAGLANGYWSFQSYNYPDRYIRHRDSHFYVESGSGDLFNKDATFKVGSSPSISSNGQINLPFASGKTWYICQGYRGGISHYYEDASRYHNIFALDLTVENNSWGPSGCYTSSNDLNQSAGNEILAPVSGNVTTVSWEDDLVCLTNDSKTKSFLIGHMTPSTRFIGYVNQNTVLGKVKKWSSINDYAHIHIAAYNGAGCTGASLPFTNTNGIQFNGASNLPSLDTSTSKPISQYRGTALRR